MATEPTSVKEFEKTQSWQATAWAKMNALERMVAYYSALSMDAAQISNELLEDYGRVVRARISIGRYDRGLGGRDYRPFAKMTCPEIDALKKSYAPGEDAIAKVRAMTDKQHDILRRLTAGENIIEASEAVYGYAAEVGTFYTALREELGVASLSQLRTLVAESIGTASPPASIKLVPIMPKAERE